MKDKNKVLISGTIDPEVFEELRRYCKANLSQSRSAVMSLALRQFLSPEHQDHRQQVVAENLDRLYWHIHNHSKRVSEELRVIREMLGLFVRSFYNHIPDVPEDQRNAAAADGQVRFTRFLEVLATYTGAGTSALEMMPESAVVRPEDAVCPDELSSDDTEHVVRKEESNGHLE